MGGLPSSFDELAAATATIVDANADNPCPVLPCMPLPSLDDVLDRLMASAKGQSIRAESIPTELVITGGLPAAKLVHSLIVSSWRQRRPPLGWKGGRVIHLPKPGSS